MIKEMECKKSWARSINFVDTNNRLVGFDFESQCCESFGYGYFKCDSDIEADNIRNGGDESDYDFFDNLNLVENPDLSEAYFAEHQPFASDGKFKIEGSPDCNWLVLYNFHNGYYCHGFVFKENGKIICEEEL